MEEALPKIYQYCQYRNTLNILIRNLNTTELIDTIYILIFMQNQTYCAGTFNFLFVYTQIHKCFGRLGSP